MHNFKENKEKLSGAIFTTFRRSIDTEMICMLVSNVAERAWGTSQELELNARCTCTSVHQFEK